MSTVSEARLLSVLDTAVDGIIVIDDKARVLVFNKACEHLFGYTAAEMLGRNVSAIMPPEYAQEHDQYVANYIRTGVRKIIGIGREVKGQHKDGTVFPIEVSVGEAATPDGRQFIGILRDVRARKEVEQRLLQLQGELVRMARVSAMDEMGAALAHELNQPLTALRLYLQSVARFSNKDHASAFPKHAKTVLEKAIHEAERAGSIVQRLRRFIEKRDPIRRLVDLNPLVEDAIELTLLGSPPGTQVSRAFADDLPQVLVDPVQIQQVIVNVVRNAVDAIRHNQAPEVAVTTSRADSRVLVRIQDNGPGIPADILPNLFRPFSSSKNRGIGLGLAISRTIAQSHGGDLNVDPGGNGRGACFTLHVPIPEPTDAGRNDNN